MTSPAADVSPIDWTDYTYDSELGIAEGVPLAFSDAARVPEGEPLLIYCDWYFTASKVIMSGLWMMLFTFVC